MADARDPTPDSGSGPHGFSRGESPQWVDYLNVTLKYLAIVWESRWGIVKISGPIAVAFAAYLYFSPGTYVSTTTILPDIQGLQNIQKRGAIGELAAAAGLAMGLTPSQLFPEIIRSERVLGEVMNQKMNLGNGAEPQTIVEYWNLKDKDSAAQYENTIKALRRAIDATLDKRTLMVTLQVTTNDPRLSALLANKIIAALDTFTLEFRKKLAGEQRTWIEKRLGEVLRDLTRSEETLKQFRERNRSVANSPQLLLEQARLAREVEINSTIFIELKKQHEIVKVEEAKNTSIVLTLDPARPPYLKSGPAKRFVFAAFFCVVLILNVVYVIGIDRMRQHPELWQRLKSLRSFMTPSKRIS